MSIPQAFLDAAEQFNRQEFWECHETLEPLWLNAPDPDKRFLQGVIQVAAGFVHVSNANYKGASRLLQTGLDKLYQTQDQAQSALWFNLPMFLIAVQDAQHEVERLGPDNIQKFCPGRYPFIEIYQTNKTR